MKRVLRFGLRIPPPAVTKTEAEAIARRECERRNWPWAEPVTVREGLRSYRFWTNARARTGNVEIVVRADNGEITRAWMGVR
jgi:hypothetical protein